MAEDKGEIKCNVVHVGEDGNYMDQLVTIPLQSGIPAGLGMLVTLKAAGRMVNNYIAENNSNPEQNLSTEFGREALLYLLSQSDCESIRFYFCKNQDDHKPLIGIPMKKDGEPVLMHGAINDETKKSLETVEKIAGIEVGGGRTIAQFISLNKDLSPDDYHYLV